MRLAIVTSHPVQYQAPLFRQLMHHAEVHVFYAHRANMKDQASAGFGVGFEWDVDLLSGYPQTFLQNVSRKPGLSDFHGCDTPSIAMELARLKPHAVLLMGWRLKSDWQAIWAARRLGMAVMVRGDSHLDTPRGLVKRASKALIYPIALRVFDAALYVGEQSRRYWAQYGYPAHRMFFSPHCVDNDWFAARATDNARHVLRAAHGISPNAKVALFAGKLVPFKRPLDLVSAASILRRKGQQLAVLVAGAGPLEAQMAEMAASSGVPLVQLGFCNQSTMPAAFAAADVLVLPSSGNETWGLVANEALACGKPVIVSDACGCAADLAADGTAGAVFRCGNIEELAGAIRQLIDHPPSCEAISAKVRRYSLEAAAYGILEAAQALQPPVHRNARHD
jgi:glycosyltransferase involved in cell wall biosynthesis